METIIISLGGSLIIPEEIDTGFLKDFKELILSEVKSGKRFILITGGGKICRKYQEAAKEIKEMKNEELDWLGIQATRFNALFLKILFGDLAEEKIILDPTQPINSRKPIIVGGGWKPGNSTDLVAITLAKKFGAKKVINLSNIDFVYNSDPKQNPKAKKIEEISWKDYRALIPKDWDPGLSSPFDPVASKLAQKEGIAVVILNGKPITNIAQFLKGEKFLGTLIK